MIVYYTVFSSWNQLIFPTGPFLTHEKDCRASSFCTAVLSDRIFSYGSSGPGLPASPRTGARPLPGCSTHSGTAALSTSSKNSELSAPHLHPGMIPIVPVPASNSSTTCLFYHVLAGRAIRSFHKKRSAFYGRMRIDKPRFNSVSFSSGQNTRRIGRIPPALPARLCWPGNNRRPDRRSRWCSPPPEPGRPSAPRPPG